MRARRRQDFNFSFIKKSWEYIKEDICKEIQKFWEKGEKNPNANIAFLTIIPKIQGANELKDYRPISMVGVIYNIISKLLSRRLKGVMGRLVGECQFSFIEKRQNLTGQ